MSQKRIKIQLRGPGPQKNILSDLDATMSFGDFQKLVHLKTGVHPFKQILCTGFPPKEIVADTEDTAVTLETVSIRNGDAILVKERDFDEDEETRGVKQGKGWDYPPTIPKGGMMVREEAPGDNSCLFHTIMIVLASQDKNRRIESTHELRELIANVVSSDTNTYNATFLGMPNQMYQSDIRHPDKWGGAIELSIFSINYQAEIIAFDFHYLREDRFGEGEGYKKRVFIIYSGNHYDAMVFSPSSGTTKYRQFSTLDDYAWERARNHAQFLHGEAVKKGTCTLQKEWRKEIRKKKKVAKVQATQGGRQLGGGDEWVCQSCTMKNSSVTNPNSCQMCALPKNHQSSYVEQKHTTTVPTPTQQKDSGLNSVSSSSIPPTGETWFCSKCTLENAITSGSCTACGTQNPNMPEQLKDGGVAPPREQTAPEALIEPITFNSLLAGAQGTTQVNTQGGATEWNCSKCTYKNTSMLAPKCAMCNSANPNAPPPVNPMAQFGQFGQQQQQSQLGGLGAGLLGSYAQRPTVWTCESCNKNNNAQVLNCQCGNTNTRLIQQMRMRQGQDPGCSIC